MNHKEGHEAFVLALKALGLTPLRLNTWKSKFGICCLRIKLIAQGNVFFTCNSVDQSEVTILVLGLEPNTVYIKLINHQLIEAASKSIYRGKPAYCLSVSQCLDLGVKFQP